MEQKTKLLLAEDDENLGLLLKEYLLAKGFETDLYPDGEAAYKGFMKAHYDICILDIMMPKKDGFSLAKDIRVVNPDIPIIFLTAKNLKDDKVEFHDRKSNDTWLVSIDEIQEVMRIWNR